MTTILQILMVACGAMYLVTLLRIAAIEFLLALEVDDEVES